MRAAVALILYVAAGLVATTPASAGIDRAYIKPTDERTWGELLAEFVGQSGFTRSYALIVGISEFDDYPELPTANDPLRMRDFLIDEAGFDYVHVLTGDKATKARIDELMVDVLPAMIDENDQFLFYWSGHGEQRPNALGGYVGYLPLAKSREDRYSTMVSMGDIRRWDALLKAKQALFLLDACFSGLAGSVSQSSSAHRDLQIDQLAKPAHHLVTAGTGDEQTIASDRWGGSIFTDAVLRAIRGEADAETSYGRDGVVSFSELISFVKTRVAIEAPAAGWSKSITPQPRDLRASTGEFFFLTNERKVAKVENAGAQYQGRFEHGVPVVVMGTAPRRACDDEVDRLFWETIKTETAPGYFEAYLKRVESGELCGLFADIARLKLRAPVPARRSTTKSAQRQPSVAAHSDPGAVEAALNLRQEERLVVQEALTALDFDTRGTDGIFGPNTRGAIAGWQRARGEQPTSYLTPSQYGRLLAEAEPKLAALGSAKRKPGPASPVRPAVTLYRYQPGKEFRDCDDCPLMVVVPAGSFTMGSPPNETGAINYTPSQGPQHEVEFAEPFAVGQYEVTFEEWDACVMAGGCNGYRPSDQTWGRGRRPVITVSWEDAQAYVAWLGDETGKSYRLLSEAEWEYVARARSTTAYWWGNEAGHGNANCDGCGSEWDGKSTAPVGSFAANKFGLRDTAGNVWEWVEDCASPDYEGAPKDGSAWTSSNCSHRVLRGGSWRVKPGHLRSAFRAGHNPDFRLSTDYGFRVARTLSRSDR